MGPIGVNELVVMLIILVFIMLLPLIVAYRLGVRRGRMLEMEKQLREHRAGTGTL
ncbi:hypothetical protein [Flaviaesturariibacter flavus]|uniref:hypothetical protein n=1 Tax=Flaviaesturariibacter flavus TaxID=2502780 RepID=UPI001404C1D1|nr:hypothetical protein [Flaviaesturariibacter flavus]